MVLTNGGGPENESHGNCDTMTKPVKARGKTDDLHQEKVNSAATASGPTRRGKRLTGQPAMVCLVCSDMNRLKKRFYIQFKTYRWKVTGGSSESKYYWNPSGVARSSVPLRGTAHILP